MTGEVEMDGLPRGVWRSIEKPNTLKNSLIFISIYICILTYIDCTEQIYVHDNSVMYIYDY